MALSVWGLTFIEPWEKNRLTQEELLFTELHEQAHARRPFALSLTYKQRCKEERRAQKVAIKQMLELGFTPQQLILMELDYRFLSKYGLRFEEYKELHL